MTPEQAAERWMPPAHLVGPTSQPLAALTFDDGPDPEFTPRNLGVLARYDVRAIFT